MAEADGSTGLGDVQRLVVRHPAIVAFLLTTTCCLVIAVIFTVFILLKLESVADNTQTIVTAHSTELAKTNHIEALVVRNYQQAALHHDETFPYLVALCETTPGCMALVKK